MDSRTCFTYTFFALISLLWLASPAAGQSTKLRYEEGDWVSYTDFRYVNSISVGHQYIYFGTTGGVTRYDRYLSRWDTPYTTSDGLSENWIERVAYDPTNEYIWCLTRSGYINYRHPTEKRWHTASSVSTGLLLSDPPQVEYPDFFTEFEIIFITEGYNATIQDRHLRTYPIQWSVIDNWDNMWIATWGLNAGTADMRTQRLEMLKFGLIESNVAAMIFDGPEMWFAGIGEIQGSQGITRFNRNSKGWSYYEARLINGLRSDNVTSMAADSQFVWFGTYNGLAQLNKNKRSWKTYTILDGLSDNEVLDVALDEERLWIGTAFGLCFMDLITGAIFKIGNENIATAIVYDIQVDNDRIWVATNHGLFFKPKERKEWEYYEDREDYLGDVVVDMAADSGSVWFAALPSWAIDERLFIKTKAHELITGKPTVPGKEPLPISLFLTMFDKESSQWQQHFPPGTFSFGTIYDLAINEQSAWIATDEGVLKFDRRRNTWRRFTTEDGLLHNTVQTILLDGDYVWFGTPQGATRFYWNDPFRID